MGRFLLALALALPLLGCSTSADVEGQRLSDVANQASQQSSQCVSEVFRRPEFAMIVDKLPPMDRSKPSMSLLANEQKPTQQEVQSLIKFYDAIQPCRTIALEGYGKVSPAYVVVIAEHYVKSDENSLALVKRNISYGEHARTFNANSAILDARFAAVGQQINDNLAVSNQMEMQRRQAAGAALLAWSAQQQQVQAQQNIANAINRPRTTQCRYVGVYLQCNTF
jgi:hypothetical protein